MKIVSTGVWLIDIITDLLANWLIIGGSHSNERI